MGAERIDAMKALMAAYRLLADAEGQAWVAQHAPLAVPQATAEAVRTINRWERTNGGGGQNRSQEYWKKLLAESAGWIRQWPAEPDPRRMRFEALAQIGGTATEEIARAGDEWLRIYEHRGDAMGISPCLSAAQVYALKGMRTAELPGLIEKGVQERRDLPAGKSERRPLNAVPRNWSAGR